MGRGSDIRWTLTGTRTVRPYAVTITADLPFDMAWSLLPEQFAMEASAIRNVAVDVASRGSVWKYAVTTSWRRARFPLNVMLGGATSIRSQIIGVREAATCRAVREFACAAIGAESAIVNSTRRRIIAYISETVTV